ncbi:MarR family transcriptional regulator [Micromonospora lupini]|uniref:MarR family winged helix-turn-helix transcriptional regulator n=1 Tax=Micromonospora lupini TaxID=285679 RepID=UPI00224C9C98|nr:MarR family transcriptional regulator [Micromonospora lupini]MCX5065978.1 MarR family transcriptional regulator [Micromonospora lupini]
MDQAILQLYRERGLESFRSNWSPVLLSLEHHPGMTIKSLAATHGVTHATMSQRIAAMVEAGLVASRPGQDARTKMISLTAAGVDSVAFARAEWEATERAVTALNEELGGALVNVGRLLTNALSERSFADRLADELP